MFTSRNVQTALFLIGVLLVEILSLYVVSFLPH